MVWPSFASSTCFEPVSSRSCASGGSFVMSSGCDMVCDAMVTRPSLSNCCSVSQVILGMVARFVAHIVGMDEHRRREVVLLQQRIGVVEEPLVVVVEREHHGVFGQGLAAREVLVKLKQRDRMRSLLFQIVHLRRELGLRAVEPDRLPAALRDDVVVHDDRHAVRLCAHRYLRVLVRLERVRVLRRHRRRRRGSRGRLLCGLRGIAAKMENTGRRQDGQKSEAFRARRQACLSNPMSGESEPEQRYCVPPGGHAQGQQPVYPQITQMNADRGTLGEIAFLSAPSA